MKLFHEIVDEAVRKSGFTLEVLAKRCGTHKGYVCGWKKGTVAPPRAKFVKRLAKALKLDYTQLLVAAELEKIEPDVRDVFRRAIELGLGRVPLPAAKDPETEGIAAAG